MKLDQLLVTLTLVAAAISFAHAQAPAASQSTANASTPASKASGSLSSAEVLSVSAKQKRVLLKHGPIPNIGMSAMTMEFVAKDSKMLRSIKKGDQVKFAADQVAGEYVVTHIEVVK